MRGRLKFLVSLAFFVISCRPSGQEINFTSEPEIDLDLDKIKERGFINAIVDNNSISYFIYKGSFMGYEYELLQRFARSIKVRLKIKIITGVEEAFNTLNTGEGDIIAFPLTITSERKKYVAFTNVHFNTSQVLVQRKPKGWRANPYFAQGQLIRNPVDLIGKHVHVMRESAFKQRLKNLSEEIGGEIIIHEDSAASETESLIHKVASGEIDYTVTDQTIGMVNAAYNPDLDVKTLLSFPQQIAWAVRKNSPQLLGAINKWLAQTKKDGTFQVIYDRYFNSPRSSQLRMASDYSSLNGTKLSPYDEYIKEGAKLLDWDWRLLASVVYQESNFQPNLVSWAGAIGLMQVMPETGKYFGITNLQDPKQNIRSGVKFLNFLNEYWIKWVPDKDQRLRFVLASYNVGLAHVIDAKNLARKYKKNSADWKEVEFFLLQKSNPKYYRDGVSKAGYCRCEGPVIYVKEVLNRYEEYKTLIARNVISFPIEIRSQQSSTAPSWNGYLIASLLYP